MQGCFTTPLASLSAPLQMHPHKSQGGANIHFLPMAETAKTFFSVLASPPFCGVGQEILKFWFGEAPYKFRSGLWWRGIDPAAPLEGPGSTDRRILERYGPLIRSCRNGVESSKVR